MRARNYWIWRTVAVTLGSDSATGITGVTGTQTAAVTATSTGVVTFAITPVSAFNGAVASASVITDESDAVDFEFLTQLNYTGGSWEKTYASTGDVGPVPYTATWEDDYISVLVTTLEPVNFNVTFDGTGDIAFGVDHQQCYMARGTTKKKFDGKSFMNWGIAKPSAAPKLSAVAPTSTALISCATGESGAFTIAYPPNVLGSGGITVVTTTSFVDDQTSSASQATRVTPGRQYGLTLGTVTKVYSADTDLSGYDDDIFQCWVKVEDVKHCRWLQFLFFVGDPGGGGDGIGSKIYAASFDVKNGFVFYVRNTKVEGETADAERGNN